MEIVFGQSILNLWEWLGSFQSNIVNLFETDAGVQDTLFKSLLLYIVKKIRDRKFPNEHTSETERFNYFKRMFGALTFAYYADNEPRENEAPENEAPKIRQFMWQFITSKIDENFDRRYPYQIE